MTTRVEYSNTFFDVFLFNAVHQFLSMPIQMLAVAFGGFVFGHELGRDEPLIAATIALSWYCGLWAFQLGFTALILWSRKDRSVLTAHVIELQSEGLLEETRYNKSIFYWPGIVKVVSRPGFVGIYVSSHLALVIPDRSFATPAERDAFLALARERINAAQA
jgi:hypothetical protein